MVSLCVNKLQVFRKFLTTSSRDILVHIRASYINRDTRCNDAACKGNAIYTFCYFFLVHVQIQRSWKGLENLI